MSSIARPAGCWPTPAQLLLLRAALEDGEVALSAWRSWQAVQRIETTDPGSVFILPQLYLNLRRLCPSEPALVKLRGVYRHTWAKNRLALEGARAATRALSEEGLRPLLLKGISLLACVHNDLGARMMIDTDVAVRHADFAAADRALTRLGWQASPAPVSFPLPPFLHAVVYTHPKWLELDLHVDPLAIPCAESALDGLWQRAQSLPASGLAAPAPEPTDLLLLTLVSGRKADPHAQCRWIADAVAILRKGPIEWDQLAARAAELQVRPTVLSQLQFLEQSIGAAIPESALQRLRSAQLHPSERERDRMLCQIDPAERPLWALLPQRWRQYRSACAMSGQTVSPLQFGRHCADYLKWKYSLRGVWQVPALLYRSYRSSHG